jgi:hypothetical protein
MWLNRAPRGFVTLRWLLIKHIDSIAGHPAMCDFPKTPKSPKALFPREKGGDEGKFSCTSR